MKNKKKTKRTKNQMKKLRRKQREMMEKNVIKRKEIKERKLKRWEVELNELTSQIKNKDDMWFHLTTPYRWEMIKKDGLKGGYKGKHSDDKGFLYLVDSDCKKLWNGIGCFHLSQKEDMRWKKDMRGMLNRDQKPYVVIGIPKEVFELMGCSLSEDTTLDLTNYNQNHRKVRLGKKVIHPSLLTKVYEDITDLDQYETKDRWVFQQKFFKRKLGKWIPKFLLTIEDGLVGVINYSERKEKTSNNLMKLSDEELNEYMYKNWLKHTLTNSDFLNTSSKQTSQMVLENRTTF